MERGDREEEAGSRAGEHVKPRELLEQNLDSKTGCLFKSNTAMLLLIVVWFPG